MHLRNFFGNVIFGKKIMKSSAKQKGPRTKVLEGNTVVFLTLHSLKRLITSGRNFYKTKSQQLR